MTRPISLEGEETFNLFNAGLSLGVYEAAFKMTNYVLILKNMHALKDISKSEHGREGVHHGNWSWASSQPP